LYAGDATSARLAANAIAKNIEVTDFSAKLITNPFINTINLNIASSKNEQLIITVNNAAGNKVLNKIIKVSAGNTALNFDAANLAHGIYFYKHYIAISICKP